jgi:hypothetical protein
MPKPTVDEVYEDLKVGLNFFSKIFKEIKKDFEYALGKQWNPDDVQTLYSRGVKALTINKIKPMIKLISGIERQSRADFKAFPEGTEDELLSEVATRLLKNVAKQSRLKHKISDQFKDTSVGGACYLEPYIDYTQDLVNGEMKFRKVEAKRVLFDPTAEEYDLSDGRFLIKLTLGLSKDDVLMLFPDKKKQLESIAVNKIETGETDEILQLRDYPSVQGMDKDGDANDNVEDSYDLIEYYYKQPYNVYYVISRSQGVLFDSENEQEALAFISAQQLPDASIVTKRTNEVRLKQIIGKTEMSDERSWTFPNWRTYPIIPMFFERQTGDGIEPEYTIQGLVRGLRDLQEEYNKRRTQELHHLNSSVNSGTFVPKDALDPTNKAKLKEFGSTPGVQIYYDPNKTGGAAPNTWKVNPTPLSQGHAQLAMENAQDIKEASGVNPDLLANDSNQQSGRAILLKQRQGLVMVQEPLDNYQQTKEIVGRFILSQLGEVYTIESAMQVLGDGFIKDNFQKPTFNALGDPELKPDGQLQTEVDLDMAKLVINKILTDSAIGKYDVTIGEGAFNETIMMANHMMLMEMAGKGIPIPPDVLIEESLLSASQKEKIIESIQKQQIAQQQMAQVAMQPQPQGMPA